MWQDLVSDYMDCDLTMKSDKLIAFAGIPQIFQKFTDDRYLAGIWASRLEPSILWSAKLRENRVWSQSPENVTARLDPSWSWTSAES